MTHLRYNEPQSWVDRVTSWAGGARAIRLLRPAVLLGIAYYAGAWIGFALTLKPSPVSTLWPPNSILLAAFLLTPTGSWWVLLLGAFVAHLAVQLQGGIPLAMVLGWFVSNSAEGLIGASIIRRFVRGPLHFDSLRQVGVFVLGAALGGTFLSSFLDAGFVSLVGWGESDYWNVWVTRSASNILASLMLVPVIVTWVNGGTSLLRAPSSRYLEAGFLGAGLLAVCILVFGGRAAATTAAPVLLYAPLPFLAWAAIRFGPRGTSTCLLFVALLAIWSTVRGHGPFVTRSPAENALSIQLFLTVFSIPLLALAAVMREREHAEHSARESQDRLKLVLCASGTGTSDWHIRDDAWSMSPQSRLILGLDDTGGVVSLNDFLRAVSSEDRAMVSQTVRDSVEKGLPYECEFRTVPRDGSVRWVLSRGEVIYDDQGAPERLVAVNVDITERKVAEKLRQDEVTLRESEARFRELADTMPQIVWSAQPNGQIDYFNRRWYELTGASVTAADESWLAMTHPDDRGPTLEAWRRAVHRGEPCEVEQRLLVHQTGEYRCHLARAVPVRSQAGAVIRWYGSCTDIEDQKRVERVLREARLALEERVVERTQELSSANAALRNEIAERVAAERALRSSEERFGKAFHSSPDAIVIVRQSDYRFIEVNEKWESLFGYSRAEALGRSANELGLVVHEEERQRGRALLEARGYLREFEMDVRNKAGAILRIVLVTDTVDMAGEPCYIIIIRDVTERKRAASLLQEQQRELAHLSRVAALGELSGALAHELNQPLAAILANARAAQRMMSVDRPNMAELREVLEDIALDDRRAGEVIARLRGLLKKGELQARPVKVEDIVGEVLGLLHSDLIQRSVAVNTRLASGVPPALADRVQLQQVLLNLILNACDAMADRPGDRLVTIATTVTAAGHIQLSVSDRGGGIAEARLDQIFEPFVTTKENGLGLGLAICRSIVTAHGGRMWAVNNPGVGATFVVELNPAPAEDPSAKGSASIAVPAASRSARRTRSVTD